METVDRRLGVNRIQFSSRVSTGYGGSGWCVWRTATNTWRTSTTTTSGRWSRRRPAIRHERTQEQDNSFIISTSDHRSMSLFLFLFVSLVIKRLWLWPMIEKPRARDYGFTWWHDDDIKAVTCDLWSDLLASVVFFRLMVVFFCISLLNLNNFFGKKNPQKRVTETKAFI